MHLVRDNMSKILTFTNNESILKHWQNVIPKELAILNFSNQEELVKYLQKNSKNILMLDENSSEDIVNFLGILKSYTQIKTILLNSRLDLAHGASLLVHGIKAYENSYLNAETLNNVLVAVNSQKMWIQADLTSFLINNYINNTQVDNKENIEIFTAKEKEVLSFITQGSSNSEIAKNLKISLSTVKGHIAHIFEKADVKDRLNLALKYKGIV